MDIALLAQAVDPAQFSGMVAIPTWAIIAGFVSLAGAVGYVFKAMMKKLDERDKEISSLGVTLDERHRETMDTYKEVADNLRIVDIMIKHIKSHGNGG